MQTNSIGKIFSPRNIKRYLVGGGLLYCVANTIGTHIGEFVICSGPSMYPTIHDGDLVIAERLSVSLFNGQTLKRGDIVGSLSPYDHTQLLCKRMVAKERDFLNEQLLPSRRVPLGHVWLEGDNTHASTDSRHFGPVPQGLVQIRLVLRIWPLNRIGWLSTHWFWDETSDAEAQPKRMR
ncbi:unnamed protein product, partial [Mesorhabditis belari]|uniref:Peptidase S26 domain-containing protein n=1 Tax=Mesorhabditis belari TaxID=2138241 RepID=A0AAF3J1X2_9BILA